MKYAQKPRKRSFLGRVTTILPASGPVGLHRETFSGSAELSFAPQQGQNAQNGKTAA